MREDNAKLKWTMETIIKFTNSYIGFGEKLDIDEEYNLIRDLER